MAKSDTKEFYRVYFTDVGDDSGRRERFFTDVYAESAMAAKRKIWGGINFSCSFEDWMKAARPMAKKLPLAKRLGEKQ